LGPSVIILGSASVPYISEWVLIPSISEGGEVIAEALDSGTPGVIVGVGVGGLEVAVGTGVAVDFGVAVGSGNEAAVGVVVGSGAFVC